MRPPQGGDTTVPGMTGPRRVGEEEGPWFGRFGGPNPPNIPFRGNPL